MRILVFGADGRLGREVVVRALAHGHEVRALTPGGTLSLTDSRLEIVRGDADDFEAVSAALIGISGVAFALPEVHGVHAYENAIATVVHAMADNALVTRLVVESAAGTFARADTRLPLVRRLTAGTVRSAAFDDLEAMELRVMASDLDWTVVRPIGLTNDTPSGQYRVSLKGEILSTMKPVSRADVAAVMVKALETDTYWRRAVTVAR